MSAQTFLLAVIIFVVCDYSPRALGRHYAHAEAQQLSKAKNYDNFRKCVEYASCEPLSPAKCFGSPLKYKHTAIGIFVPSSQSSTDEEVLEWGAADQREAHEKLEKWAKYLRHFPACWKKVQPFLCAMYLPPCNNGTVQVPRLRLCEEINEACAIIEKTVGWPGFLQCYRGQGHQQGHRFPSSCTNSIEEIQFNTTSKCVGPLVSTVTDSDSWYEETECGLQCRDPLFTKSEIDRVSVFIFVLAVLCLMTTGFTIFTFIIDWKKANFYPPLVLFYLNLSFFAGTWGWMAQFFPGSKEDIVCRKDLTIRHSEPKNETQSCLVVFFIIYYSFLSGLIWFVILSFCWYLNYQKGRGDLTKLREYLRGKTAYFHLVAWSVPLVLCIIISGMSKLDGDYLAGVCFMGYRRRGSSGVWMPIFFVLLPMILAASASGFFIFRGVRVLLFIQKNPAGSSSSSSNPKRQVPRISRVMTRMGIFSFFALLIVATSFGCHFYIFLYQADWEQSLRDYVVCRAGYGGASAMASPHDPCFKAMVRPNVSLLQLHIFCYFAAGMLMSLWVWNARSLATWKQFFRKLRKCGRKDKTPVATSTPEGVESVAMTSRRRQDLGSTPANGPELTPFVGAGVGDGSDDPIGMGWELNSLTTASQISSTWAIPNFILRGRGLPHQTPTKADSSTSISDGLAAASRQRRLSMDSHASQSSQAAAAAVAVAARGHRRNAHALRKRRMQRPPLNELASAYKRRNSDTSASSLALSGGVQGHALHPLRKSLSNSQNSLFQETSFISAQGIGSARSLFTRSASELNSGMESDRNSILNMAAAHHAKRAAAHRSRKESGTSKGAETENESITGGPWGMNGFPGFSPHLPFMSDPYWASQLGGGTGIPGYPYGGGAGAANPFAALFPPGMTDFGAAFGMGAMGPFGPPNVPPHMAAMSAMMGMAGMSAAGPLFGASSLGDSAYPPSMTNLNPPRRQISGHIPGKGSSVSEAVMAQADVSGSEKELTGKGKPTTNGGTRHGRTISRTAGNGARGEKGAAGGGPLAGFPPNGFTSLADVVAMQMAAQAQEAVQSATASQAAAAAENPLSNMTVCPMQQNINLENQSALANLPPSMFTFNMQHHQQQKLFSLGGAPVGNAAGAQPLSTGNLNTMNMNQAQQIAAVQQQQMQAAAQQQFQMMAMHHQMMMAAAAAAAAQHQTQANPAHQAHRSGGSKAPSILGAPTSSSVHNGKRVGNTLLDPNGNLKCSAPSSTAAGSTVAKRKGPEKGSFRRSQSRQSKPTGSSFESVATE